LVGFILVKHPRNVTELTATVSGSDPAWSTNWKRTPAFGKRDFAVTPGVPPELTAGSKDGSGLLKKKTKKPQTCS